MSILKSTNTGLYGQKLTPEVAQALGWKIENVHGQQDKEHNWKCINMIRTDICAPLDFWYHPHDKFDYCRIQLFFFGDEELGIKRSSSRFRIIKTVSELNQVLEFLKTCEKHREKLKKAFQHTIEPLDDPNKEYYI